MNCEKGEMAIIIHSESNNLGKIVTCIRYVGLIEWSTKYNGIQLLETWETDKKLSGWEGDIDNTVPDCQLRPLRGDLKGDEDLYSDTLDKEREFVLK